LLGVTEQLVGTPWLHAPPFGYAGNIGPAEAHPVMEYLLIRTGEALAEMGGLRGVWGIDFVHGTDFATYPVEVNPRYTAGIEVLEHATTTALLASGGREPPVVTPMEDKHGAHAPRSPGRVVGKGIYFAPHAITFPACGPWDTDLAGAFDPWRLPAFADIPEAGSRVDAGQPVITVLVSGSSTRECRERLQSRAAELDALFAGAEP
jgi:predicted ATP-grasp superfamily ATP-dependent carboligase